MAREVPQYAKQLQISGRIAPTQFSTGSIKNMQRQSDLMAEKATKIDERIAENAFGQAQNTLAANVARMEREYANNPEALNEALTNYKDTFFEEINDPEVADRMALQYDRTSILALERAKDNQQRVINDQAVYNSLQSMAGINEEIRGISDSIFSDSPSVSAAAQSSMQEILDRADTTLRQTDSAGNPLFDASQRFTLMTNAKDSALEGAVFAYFESQADKTAALQKFKNGELKLSLPDGNGGLEQIDLRTALSEQSIGVLEAEAERQIAKVQAERGAQAADAQANIDIAVEVTEDPKELLNLQKQLDVLRPDISPSGYESSTVKIINKIKKQQEVFTDAAAGSAFASGEMYLNPQDEKAKKQFNAYYDTTVAPGLAGMETPARNTYLTNMLVNSKVIPDRLQGDIAAASRSLKMDEVTAAADLVDRIRAANPNLLRDVNQQDLARLDLVRSLKEGGYEDAEAFERADKALDPTNAAVLKTRRDELAKAKIPYRLKAVNALKAPLFTRAFPGDTGTVADTDAATPYGPQLIQLEADYKRAYESQYDITGNTAVAEKHANDVVKGLYGVTKVNGKNQVMKYAPENYYSIPGVKNDWMREQILTEVKRITKNSMMDPDFNPGTDVLVVPDPNVTARTAKTGQPAYKLMFIQKSDGSLRDLLGPNQYFYFDPQAKKDELVAAAKKKAPKVPHNPMTMPDSTGLEKMPVPQISPEELR